MASGIRKISLEKLTKEKFPRDKVRNVNAIEVEIWEKTKPGLVLNIDKNSISVRLTYRASTKIFLAWLGGIAATAGSIIAILKWLTPILVGYYANLPP